MEFCNWGSIGCTHLLVGILPGTRLCAAGNGTTKHFAVSKKNEISDWEIREICEKEEYLKK